MGRGKLIEDAKFQVLFPGGQYSDTSAAVCYGRPVDTKDYDEAVFLIHANSVPTTNTLTPLVVENSIADPVGAVAVTSAAFTALSASNYTTPQVGSVVCKNTKRFLFLKTTMAAGTGANPTIGFGATVVLSKADKGAVDNGPVFDIDNL